jgi:hypothetical protein
VSGIRFFHPVNFRHVFMPFLVLILFAFNAGAQKIQVQSAIENDTIQIGAQTILHISARIPSKSIIAFPQLEDSLGKIKIVNGPKTDTAFDKKDPASETVTQSYRITAFDEGTYVIPAWEFHTQAGFFRTTALALRVKSIPVDTTKAFYDIKQPFVVSYTFWDWLRDHWLQLLLGAIIVLLLIVVAIYMKSRRKGPIIKKAAPVLTAAELALKKLYGLRDKKSGQQGDAKVYYIELTDILRDYLEAHYQIKTHEQTSAEIFAALENKDISADASNSLKKLLTLADLVKFAKHQPSAAEDKQCLEAAVDFVMQTGLGPQAAGQREGLQG